MAKPSELRVQQLLQNGLRKTTRSYFSDHIDARSVVEQAQRNVRQLVRKAEQQDVRWADLYIFFLSNLKLSFAVIRKMTFIFRLAKYGKLHKLSSVDIIKIAEESSAGFFVKSHTTTTTNSFIIIRTICNK
jgi:hypothetical protein